jgi:hypothetical protein
MRPKGLPPSLRHLPIGQMHDQVGGDPTHADRRCVSARAFVYQQPGHRILRRLPQCILLPHLAKARVVLEADYSSNLPIFARSPANCLLHSLQHARMDLADRRVEAASHGVAQRQAISHSLRFQVGRCYSIWDKTAGQEPRSARPPFWLCGRRYQRDEGRLPNRSKQPSQSRRVPARGPDQHFR